MYIYACVYVCGVFYLSGVRNGVPSIYKAWSTMGWDWFYIIWLKKKKTTDLTIKMGIWTWTMKIGMNHDEAAKKGDVTNHEWNMEILAS